MRDPEKTRNLIVNKAISIFNTKGYRATSLSDITKATGLTKGAIYGHFKSKDDVAESSFIYAIQKIMGQLRSVISGAPDAPGKLKAILEYYANYIQKPPIEGGCPVINTSVEADDDHPKLRAQVIRFIGIFKDSLKKIMYRGIKEGQIKAETNIEEFAMLYYAALEGAILQSRIEGDVDTYGIVMRRLFKDIDEITA